MTGSGGDGGSGGRDAAALLRLVHRRGGGDDPESGVRNLDIAFDGEPVAPGQVIHLAELAGAHTFTVRAANHAGLVTATSVAAAGVRG